MSDCYEKRHVKSTRKDHVCEYCGEAIRLAPGPVPHHTGVEFGVLQDIHAVVIKVHAVPPRFQGGSVEGGCVGKMGILSSNPLSKMSRSAYWGLASTNGAVKLGLW